MVVGVDDAAGTLGAGSWARPANTATLAPFLRLGERVREDRSEDGERGRELHVCRECQWTVTVELLQWFGEMPRG